MQTERVIDFNLSCIELTELAWNNIVFKPSIPRDLEQIQILPIPEVLGYLKLTILSLDVENNNMQHVSLHR